MNHRCYSNQDLRGRILWGFNDIVLWVHPHRKNPTYEIFWEIKWLMEDYEGFKIW